MTATVVSYSLTADNAPFLDHWRGEGLNVLYCWVVDVVLVKE